MASGHSDRAENLGIEPEGHDRVNCRHTYQRNSHYPARASTAPGSLYWLSVARYVCFVHVSWIQAGVYFEIHSICLELPRQFDRMHQYLIRLILTRGHSEEQSDARLHTRAAPPGLHPEVRPGCAGLWCGTGVLAGGPGKNLALRRAIGFTRRNRDSSLRSE
jgi:hypothetical protein